MVNKIIIFAMILALVVPTALATETLAATTDCSTASIHYTDNPEWGREERIKAMDKAFFESIHRFELCNLSNQSNALPTTANGMESASGSGNSSGIENNSNKSATMKGTETGTEKEGDPLANRSPQPEKTNRQSTRKPGSSNSTNNGVRPKDIPRENNDDIIAAQIRVAAEIEQDAAKKKKLWNEYRKYKGLPTQ